MLWYLILQPGTSFSQLQQVIKGLPSSKHQNKNHFLPWVCLQRGLKPGGEKKRSQLENKHREQHLLLFREKRGRRRIPAPQTGGTGGPFPRFPLRLLQNLPFRPQSTSSTCFPRILQLLLGAQEKGQKPRQPHLLFHPPPKK